jgi:CheY-like chemotaxis protein
MKRIILIDDEAGVRELWQRFHDVMEPTFRGECELETATSLEMAMVMITGKDYDAIILDLMLPPNTIDQSISFIFEQSQRLPPIIVLTASEDIYIRRRCMIAGAAGFWTKPDAVKHPNLFFKELYNEYLKRYATQRAAA